MKKPTANAEGEEKSLENAPEQQEESVVDDALADVATAESDATAPAAAEEEQSSASALMSAIANLQAADTSDTAPVVISSDPVETEDVDQEQVPVQADNDGAAGEGEQAEDDDSAMADDVDDSQEQAEEKVDDQEEDQDREPEQGDAGIEIVGEVESDEVAEDIEQGDAANQQLPVWILVLFCNEIQKIFSTAGQKLFVSSGEFSEYK